MWHLAFYRDWEDFLHKTDVISFPSAWLVSHSLFGYFFFAFLSVWATRKWMFVRRRTQSQLTNDVDAFILRLAWLTCFIRIDGLLTFPLSIVCLECFSFSLAFCSGGHCLNLKCRIWDSITWGVCVCVCVKVWSVFWPSFPFSVFFDVLVCMLDLWKIHSS